MSRVDPASAKPDQADSAVSRAVAAVLGAGVVTAVVLVALGLVVTLVTHPRYAVGPVSYHLLVGRHARFPVGLRGLVHALAHGRGAGIVLLGTVVLLATPILGVVAALVGFLRARTARMALVALVVLVILVGAAVVL